METQTGEHGMSVHCGMKPTPVTMGTKFPKARMFRQNASLMDLAMCEQRRDEVWGYKVGDVNPSWYGFCALWWGSDFAFNDGVTLSRERGCYQALETGKGPRGSNLEVPLEDFALTKDGDCMMYAQGRLFGSKSALPDSIDAYERAHWCTRGAGASPLTVRLDDPATCKAFWFKQRELKRKGACASSALPTPRQFLKPYGGSAGRGIFT